MFAGKRGASAAASAHFHSPPKNTKSIEMKDVSTTTLAAAMLMTATFLALAPPAAAQTPIPKSQPKSAGTTLPKESEEEIRKTVMDYEKAWNTHDMELLATLIREDAEFINVVGMHWRGRDAIVKAHAIFHEIMFKDNRFKTDSIETRPLGSDHAIAIWTATQDSYTTPSGKSVPKGQFKLSLILAKEGDGWKVVHGHNVRIDAGAVKHDPVNSGYQPDAPQK
jgi:uncharacterized protein (TIGR02246 family)